MFMGPVTQSFGLGGKNLVMTEFEKKKKKKSLRILKNTNLKKKKTKHARMHSATYTH